MTDDDLLNVVKKTILGIEAGAQIILFGSRSRKEPRFESDWDFLILVDGPVDDARIDQIRHRLYEVEWDTGEVISSIVRNRKKWSSHPNITSPFYENITQEGIVL